MRVESTFSICKPIDDLHATQRPTQSQFENSLHADWLAFLFLYRTLDRSIWPSRQRQRAHPTGAAAAPRRRVLRGLVNYSSIADIAPHRRVSFRPLAAADDDVRFEACDGNERAAAPTSASMRMRFAGAASTFKCLCGRHMNVIACARVMRLACSASLRCA